MTMKLTIMLPVEPQDFDPVKLRGITPYLKTRGITAEFESKDGVPLLDEADMYTLILKDGNDKEAVQSILYARYSIMSVRQDSAASPSRTDTALPTDTQTITGATKRLPKPKPE